MILYLFYNIFLDYDFVLGICDDVVVDLLDNLLGMFMIIMIINGFNMIFLYGWNVNLFKICFLIWNERLYFLVYYSYIVIVRDEYMYY